MATTTFHPFPRLPSELRARIWELAIRPSLIHGAHYFSIPPVSTKPNDEKAPGREGTVEEIIAYEPCRSVFRWDAGLQFACREARDAVRRSARPIYPYPDDLKKRDTANVQLLIVPCGGGNDKGFLPCTGLHKTYVYSHHRQQEAPATCLGVGGSGW